MKGANNGLNGISQSCAFRKPLVQALLDNKRVEYGKPIIATLSQQLTVKYGDSFECTNVSRMKKSAELLGVQHVGRFDIL